MVHSKTADCPDCISSLSSKLLRIPVTQAMSMCGFSRQVPEGHQGVNAEWICNASSVCSQAGPGNSGGCTHDCISNIMLSSH